MRQSFKGRHAHLSRSSHSLSSRSMDRCFVFRPQLSSNIPLFQESRHVTCSQGKLFVQFQFVQLGIQSGKMLFYFSVVRRENPPKFYHSETFCSFSGVFERKLELLQTAEHVSNIPNWVQWVPLPSYVQEIVAINILPSEIRGGRV